MTNKTAAVIHTTKFANQKSMAESLMIDLRAAINDPKYDTLSIATLLGVLEMLKIHFYKTTFEDDTND
jgi:hypothetical protein